MKFEATAIVKLVPPVRAETVGICAVVLQVTPSFVPSEESKVTRIWLFAVTAVVSTTTLLAAAAMFTEPEAAEPHTAGDAEDVQFPITSVGVNTPLGVIDGKPPLGDVPAPFAVHRTGADDSVQDAEVRFLQALNPPLATVQVVTLPPSQK